MDFTTRTTYARVINLTSDKLYYRKGDNFLEEPVSPLSFPLCIRRDYRLAAGLADVANKPIPRSLNSVSVCSGHIREFHCKYSESKSTFYSRDYLSTILNTYVGVLLQRTIAQGERDVKIVIAKQTKKKHVIYSEIVREVDETDVNFPQLNKGEYIAVSVSYKLRFDYYIGTTLTNAQDPDSRIETDCVGVFFLDAEYKTGFPIPSDYSIKLYEQNT